MSSKIAFSRQKLLPLVLIAAVVVADQLTKIAVVRTIQPGAVGFSLGGDFLRIIHVYNTGIAFSIGHDWPLAARVALFRVVPLVVLAAVTAFSVASDELTTLQRWVVAGIVGGGAGNLIDRFFRGDGVVDFIDVKFYGLFGFERWPTFNVADSAVVVCGILLVLSFLVSGRKGGGAK